MTPCVVMFHVRRHDSFCNHCGSNIANAARQQHLNSSQAAIHATNGIHENAVDRPPRRRLANR
eukprot:11186236-Lingulodinium_polyedra.AAC.1